MYCNQLNVLLTHFFIFLNLDSCSKPQQLSTYALTLFNYETKINGNILSVGKY